MVFFKDYTCPSSQLKYLIVGTEGHRMILEELRWGDNIVLEGGLPINGVPYEEVIPNSTKLTGLDDKRKIFLSRTCECMFAAFHHLKEKNNGNMRVSFNEWIQFWCKKDRKYVLAPPRKEKKSRRLSSTHNPTGEIPTEINTWSSTQEMVFSKLGAKHQKYKTHLTAFLSCWLCAFVFPSEEGNFIRPETFKIASLMASGKRVSLAVSVLASIYHGLNNISNSSQLDHIRVCFPIHYVYGWLAYYLKTHYPFTSGRSLPRMVVYSGEGATKYFDKDEARKHVHQGENIVWNATMLSRPHPNYYIDDGKAPELELAYFMSLHIPGYLENDIRAESLDEGLRYWRICISRATMSKATFLPAKAGSEFVTLLEDKSQDIEKTLSKVKTPLAPQHQSKKLNSSKVSKKEVVHTSTDKEKCPQFLFSSKGALQETSKTSKDRCWKRQRVEPSGAEVVDLRVVEVQSVNAAEHPLGSPHEMPQVSDESIAISRPKAQSISNIEQEQKTSSTSRGQTLKGLTPNSNEFFQRVMELCLSSKEKEMSEMNLLDLSPLKILVDSLFDHATSYDQEHSNFVDKSHKDKKMELISNAKERLELFKVEEGEKAKHVSSNKKSLKKVKRNLATLQGEREGLEAVLEVAKKKVEEVQAKILATEEEISSYENMSLLTLEDSISLEQKRECLEASRQDLTNYKLRLD
ncbi:hypothetical protein KY285_034510 [Solanum tuberosum]|nr:hypothetical protein KY289_032997 [Solanum tuberosum]KAH0649262.1 hypothetical protein KY285_034510 [Solanum tuberosum]